MLTAPHAGSNVLAFCCGLSVVLQVVWIMKILLNWLSDYIQTGLTGEEIAAVLSDLGLPCEGIEHTGTDVIIDVEVTSNRSDCLGYIGIARELSAATGKELKLPTVELGQAGKRADEFAAVEIVAPGLCGRYTARIIEGVKVGPSPDWAKKRLEAIGMRSVNNVVDATNYAMIETGQPPHAFDYAKLADGKIIVRRALAGERIVSIDGSMCDLDNSMLIIADAHKPVAIAGVMGGLETEVSDKTTTILLEDAYFDPVSIRRTARKLALFSEASFRFERTVDIEAIDWASKRTAQLITLVAGGKAAAGVIDIYPGKKTPKQVTLRLSRFKKLIGIDVAAEKVLDILSGLALQPVRKDDAIVCTVPSHRSDIYREADLIEEVARVWGYHKVPTQRKIEIETVAVDNRQKLTQSIVSYLNSCGFYETVNVTFVDAGAGELFTGRDSSRHLAVKDVSRKSTNLLRQTLVGSLMGVLKTNLAAGNRACKLFEIATTFVPEAGARHLPTEKTTLAVACTGQFRYLRGVVEGLLHNVIDKDIRAVFNPIELPWSKVAAEIMVNGELAGVAGIVSQAVQRHFDLEDVTVCAAEMDFGLLSALQVQAVKIRPIPKFPAIERDLSVIVAETVSWEKIVEAVRQKAPQELEDIRFVDLYRDSAFGADNKSITLSVRFRDERGTLTHEMVDAFESRIVKNLTRRTGAKLRTI